MLAMLNIRTINYHLAFYILEAVAMSTPRMIVFDYPDKSGLHTHVVFGSLPKFNFFQRPIFTRGPGRPRRVKGGWKQVSCTLLRR
jgi:hypothetical protein